MVTSGAVHSAGVVEAEGKLGRSREGGSGLLSHGPAGELGDWDAEGSDMS